MSTKRIMHATALAIAFTLAHVPAALTAQVGPHDIALGKPAHSVSNFNGGYSASTAVDGNTDGNSISHTAFDYNAWWYVDLGTNAGIGSITLWNRAGYWGYRLENFYLSVLADGTPNVGLPGAPTVWSQFVGPSVGVSETFTPPSGTAGRYVKVQFDGITADHPGGVDPNGLAAEGPYLQLAEVDVEGVASTVTPEPSALVLFATGFAVIAALCGRRQHMESRIGNVLGVADMWRNDRIALLD